MKYKLDLDVWIELEVTNKTQGGYCTSPKQVMVNETKKKITIEIPDNYFCAFDCIDAEKKLLKLRAVGTKYLTEEDVQSLKGKVNKNGN